MKPSRHIRLLAFVFVAVLMSACGGGGDDADQDGVRDSDDAAPNDTLCSAPSDVGNGACYLRTLAAAQLTVVGNAQGKIFFRVEGDVPALYAYDLVTRHFLGRTVMSGFAPTAFAYVPDHGRLYVGDADGTIHAYTEALTESATAFAKMPLRVAGLSSVGKYLLAQDASGSWGTHSLFDQAGNRTDSKEWKDSSRFYEWVPSQSRLYFFRDDTSPDDLMFEEVDQATGKIMAAGESPYHGAYIIEGPIRANGQGTKVLLGSGDLYAAPALTWAGKIASGFTDAMWLANDDLLVTSVTANVTRLLRYHLDRFEVEELRLDGELLAMAQQNGNNYLILKTTTHVDIRSYIPSNDNDADGVSNLVDRFPLDKTAAVDSDGDGHPDAWLNGYTAVDSTTGLTLDSYRLDASCHAPEQGDGVRCDPALSVPSFIPERVLEGPQGTVFLFARAQSRIYRWSGATGAYRSPLVVGQQTSAGLISPISIAYSSDHQRLYLGYESGRISYIDLAGNGLEQVFTATSMSVKGLAAVGKYLLAQDASGTWATHHLYDQAGTRTDSKELNYYSRFYEWAPGQARAYFFRDDIAPNDLQFEEIDQATGKIMAAGETPYHGGYNIQGPIRVSPDGTRIILGSGDVYSTVDLTVVASLPTGVADMQWQDDGSLVAIRRDGNDTRLTVYSSAFAILREQVISGEPVAVLRIGSGLAVFSQMGGQLRVTQLTM